MLLFKQIFRIKKIMLVGFFFLLAFHVFAINNAINNEIQDSLKFVQFKGKVINSHTKKPLIFASITINNTNISTITNTQGRFLLKVPIKYTNQKITISFLGYTSKVLNLKNYKNKSIIRLETYIEELSEVKIRVKDAQSLILEMLKRKDKNYFNELTTMTAFYRETIKKRRTYVSLSEAIIKINKQSYLNSRNDIIKLFKSRKKTDYTRLDTVAFKLRGGPFNTLFIDIMKNTELFFTEDMTAFYDFTFDKSTKMDNRLIYVVNFKQKTRVDTPLFYGKLYIDAQTLALTNAKFQLNIANKKKASKVFIIKKPKGAKVYPVEASYQIGYRQKNGKWYYGYSRIQLGFKINWDKKLFNTIYYTTMEMAVTNWKKNQTNKLIKYKERLRPSVVMSEKAAGFSDPNFWGEYNVIEPEKSIEIAIKKIKKKLKKLNDN